MFSGCSRHMTGNMSYLSDFKEFDGGYVTFGGRAKGSKITCKRTLKSGKLDFKDVYFVKELQFNLFSVSQMCDKKNSVLFTDTGCFVMFLDFKLADESQVLLKVPRKNNMYIVDMKNIVPKESLTCLVAKATLDESMLWHRRLGHVNFKTINKLVKDNLVRVYPQNVLKMTKLVLLALRESNTKPHIENLVVKKVKIIICDNRTEFKNRVMSEFCEKKGIKREFSIARTPQQNGVAKRRNRTLIKATRTMLADSKLHTTFWAEAVNTACYVQNRVLVVKPHKKTPYELFRGRTPALRFTRPFGCHVTILNTLDYLGKFDGKSNEGLFVRYLLNNKAFRVYNIRTRKVEESLHIRFLEDKPIIAGDGPKWLFDIDVLTKSINYVLVVAGTNSNDLVGTEESIGTGHSSKETGSIQDNILMPLWKDGSLFDSSSKNANNDEPQPSSDAEKKNDEGVNKESGIDDQERPRNNTQDVNTDGPSINSSSTNVNTGCLNINIVRPIVTTTLLEATHADFFGDETKLDMSNITTTYPVPSTPNTRIHKDHSLDDVIGDIQYGHLTRRMTKTSNEQGFISAVYKGKTHETFILIEGMQDELLQFKLQKVWTLVDLLYGKRAIGTKWVYRNKKDEKAARIEAIRMFLAYALFKDFVVYKMDVKSAFLYGKIKEEVYVCQPLGFEDPEFPDRVYKVEKALYGLHQALRAWVKGDILLVQVYIDDIIFGSTRNEICTEFEKKMHKKFQMSSMGELTFFLGLAPMETSKPLLKDAEAEDVDVHLYRSMIGSLMYLIASRPDIMFVICAYARFQVTPKISHLHVVKRIFRYLKGQPKLDLWYPKDSPFNLEAYTDNDYAVANSTTEASKIFIDNKSTIIIVKNPVFHSKTKHIEIRHHFIRDSNKKKLIQMIKIHTDQNVADLLTKAFDVGRFQYLIASIGMLNL
ncbi:putative ribonuclease H-like domain-containing protein [Tanacetum coccineum]